MRFINIQYYYKITSVDTWIHNILSIHDGIQYILWYFLDMSIGYMKQYVSEQFYRSI